MANHKHDHNHELTTTVAMRAEVERALASAVPQERQRRQAVERVEQVIERYSSPYPDPKYLEQIEKLAPGSTQQIIACSIDDLKHRQRMDVETLAAKREEIQLVKTIASGELASTTQGRWLGFGAYIACLMFSGTMYWLGSEKLALAGFGAAALGIIGQLIRGGTNSVVLTRERPDDDQHEKKSKLTTK